jgi:aryl-alcohol dehydrogenase-like predicted oxidoreductase
MSVGEIVEALNAEIQRSRVRFLGARNWSAARISAANAYAAEHEL